MRLPKQGTRTYDLLMVMLKHGPLTYIQAAERFPNMSRNSFHATVAQYGLIKNDDSYGLPTWLSQLLAEGTAKSKKLGPLVPSRTPAPFKPLSGHWTVTGHPSGRVEERSFVSTATSVPAYRNL